MTQHVLKYIWMTVILVVALHMCSQQPHVAATTAPEVSTPVNPQAFRAPILPAEMSFAGERVPLEVFDVAERMDRELLSNSYYHSGTLLALKRMQRHVPSIKKQLQENNIPEDFIYLALAESLFGQVTSPAGASGFWQLMTDTARGYGIQINDEVDERFHVEKSTVAATKYLKSAKNKFGTWTNAAASYNRGIGGLDRAMKQQKVTSYYDLYLNDETSRYMFRILALKEILSNPERYGFSLSEEQGYNPLPSRALTVTSSIPDLPAFALEQGTNYKTLKLYNPWIKAYKLTVPAGKEYVLQMPVK